MAAHANSIPAPASQGFPQTLEHGFDPADVVAEIAGWDRFYGMQVNGDCMAPDVRSGEVVVLDKEGWPTVGDLAVVFVHGTKNGRVGVFPWLKRITMGMWETKLPYRLVGDSSVIPLVSFASNAPGQAWTVKATSVYGLHKCIGKRDDLVWDGNLWVPRPKGRGRLRKPATLASDASVTP